VTNFLRREHVGDCGYIGLDERPAAWRY